MESFHDVTEVTFEELSEDREKCKHRFSIRAPEEVRLLVSLARPKPWTNGIPMCIHTLQATFKKPSGSTVIDFCRICFGRDAMPAEFYAEYLRLSRRHMCRWMFLYSALASILAFSVLAVYLKVLK